MAEYINEFLAYDNPEALARGAANWLCGAATEGGGRFSVCLAGGSTPKRLYELLSEPGICERFPWQRVHWFWGDERFVPHTDPQSNYRMVLESMISRVDIPPANIHPIPTEGMSPTEAVTAYEHTLQAFYGADALDPRHPLFDVTLLGLGEDGHTASLFPGTSALDERRRWAIAITGIKPEARISLTFPVLNASRDIVFLVAGDAKRSILSKVRRGEDFPAGRVRPQQRILWMVDRAAVGDDG